MPRAVKRYSLDAGVLAEVEKRTEATINGELGVLGPPADAVTLSDNEALEWFEWADPAVTPDMLAGLDDEAATFLKYPRRFQLMQSISDDPEAQVKAMDRYRRLSDERRARREAENTRGGIGIASPVSPLGAPSGATTDQYTPPPAPGPLTPGPWQPPARAGVPAMSMGDVWEMGGV